MTEEERAARAEWIRQQAEAVKAEVDGLRMQNAVLRIALQSLLAQLLTESQSNGALEQTRMRAAAILASDGAHPHQQAMQALLHEFYVQIYEAAGRTKPEAKPWGGDA